MKTLICFISIHYFTFFSISQKTDLQKDNLIGTVKSVEESYYLTGINIADEGEMGLESIVVTKYGKNGFIIEKNGENLDGTLNYRNIYKYDSVTGLLVETNFYDENEKLKYTTNFKFENGNLIEENIFDEFGNPSYSFSNKYDANGNLIEEHFYNENGVLIWKSIFTVDPKGAVLEKKTIIDESFEELNTKETYVYDTKGNIISSKRYGLENTFDLITNKYEYDSQGNWIKRTEFENNKPKAISEKKIEYY